MPQQYKISQYSPQNEFGGCDVIVDVLRKIGMRGFIDGLLPNRKARADYKYSEGILSWFINLCCKGDCLEDMELNREQIFKHPRFHALPPRYVEGMSPDTFSKICAELVEESTEPTKKSHEVKLPKKPRKRKVGRPKKRVSKKIQLEKRSISTHQINSNEKMNHLLLKTALKLGLLKRNVPYTFDFDTSPFVSKIADCRKWYDGKGERAYCPAIASINNIPVYIENRNGDTPSSWNLMQTVDTIIKNLTAEGIVINTIRIDRAAYNSAFIEYANLNGFRFVTRVRDDRMKKELGGVSDWELATLSNVEVELAETEMKMKGTTGSYRIIIKHIIEKDQYWSLITNIRDLSKKEICELYTVRSGVGGAGEHVIQMLKGDFVCNHLPFRTFEKNTVFIGISAICYCIYKYLVRKFARVLRHLNPKMQLCTFIDVFVKGKTYWKRKKLFLVDKIARMYERLSGFT